jgi:hypothetical protein
LARDETSQALSYASSHLNVLSLCSYNSKTARTLYTTLQIIFNDIREIAFSPVYRAMCELRLDVKDTAHVPSSYYEAVEGSREMCEDIMDLARRVVDVLQESIDV